MKHVTGFSVQCSGQRGEKTFRLGLGVQARFTQVRFDEAIFTDKKQQGHNFTMCEEQIITLPYLISYKDTHYISPRHDPLSTSVLSKCSE